MSMISAVKMKLPPMARFISKYSYEIPETYHNSFYLANASLFQVVNYFAHKAYHVVFPELVEKAERLKLCSNDGEATKLIEDHIRKLEYCDQFVDFRYPIIREFNGRAAILRGMRAYHGLEVNNNICLGGMRIFDSLSRHTVQGFAVLSTYRNACFGLETSGSYGGIKICAPMLESGEMKQAVQMYTKALLANDFVYDVIEPDFYCGPEEMDLMNAVCPEESKVCIVGKSGGSNGLQNYYKTGSATVLCLMKKFLENKAISEKIELDNNLKNKTFIIYGLGKNGGEIAKTLEDQGAVCVGVREFNCTIYEPSGISVKVLLKHYEKFGSILNFSPKAKETESDQIFTEKCDILILAAIERSIMCHIADRLEAKVIIEACNGPITPTGDRILYGKQKLIIPSILTGGGYTLKSYFEYLRCFTDDKNLQEAYKNEGKLDETFELLLGEVADDVIKIESDLKLDFDFRTACYVKAIRKIFDKLLTSSIMLEKRN